MTGHSYIVYGPLANGATSVIYEGTPDFPDKDRFWEIVERYKVTILYTAPTAIRTFMKWGTRVSRQARSLVAAAAGHRRRADQSRSVDVVSRVDRRQPRAGRRHVVADGDRRHHDRAAARHHDAASRQRDATAARHRAPTSSTTRGESVPLGGGGYIVLTRPWPGMLRGIWGDDERYQQTYWSKFPHLYLAGDGCRRDADGNYWFMGRIDDVMNVSGHRISTTEVESALVDHPQVAEAAVCGKLDDMTGQAIYAFVSLQRRRRPARRNLPTNCAITSREQLGKFTRPKYVTFTQELPKTRSGKIMRRLLARHRRRAHARRYDDARRFVGRARTGRAREGRVALSRVGRARRRKNSVEFVEVRDASRGRQRVQDRRAVARRQRRGRRAARRRRDRPCCG